MEFLKVLGASLFSLAVLFLLTKLMGNKQISQLTMFDYITGITIGSIAAELATELENPLRPTVAMVIYGLAAALISFCCTKSNALRAFFGGKPIVLLQNGRLSRENLKKAKLDLNEFLTMARLSGYFDLSQIQTAVFEKNGDVSFLPKARYRPVNPEDMKLPVRQEELLLNVIVDGKVMERELALAGREEKWLREQLKKQGCGGPEQVLLASVDRAGKLTCFPMEQSQKASK